MVQYGKKEVVHVGTTIFEMENYLALFNTR